MIRSLNQAQRIFAEALDEARREGYLAGLAHAETALYSGTDALVQLLSSVPKGEA
jgi:hypothetical protein